jgi:hypothetical protein
VADDPKLAEFRQRNIDLLKEINDLKAKYEGIDPEAVKADRARLAELEKIKPQERITALETELATEKAAHATARQQADAFVIDTKITDAFLKAGGRPEARAFIVAAAAGQFTVEKGELKGTKFSPDRPGEPMTLTEWLTLQTKSNAFCFLPSVGSGSRHRSDQGSASGGARVLRNPTERDLGRCATEIAKGEMRIEYDHA